MILYCVTRFFVRASIIFFYMRVFPPKPDQKLGRIVQATFVFNVVYNVSFLFAVIFQCSPLSHFWWQWDGEHTGTCGNANILAWVAAATGIAYDLWLLALPFSQLLTLNLHWKRKLMGGMMFFVGVACVHYFFRSSHFPAPFLEEGCNANKFQKQQRHDHQSGPPQNHQRIHARRQPNQFSPPPPLFFY
jgi:hypothetical protein